MPSHLAKPAKLGRGSRDRTCAAEAYETSALPTELFRGVRLKWLPLLGSNQALRGQSPVPYQLGEGATRLVPRAGFEPAPPDLKDRGPRPLDERGDMERTARIELANRGFADPCLTTWLRGHKNKSQKHLDYSKIRLLCKATQRARLSLTAGLHDGYFPSFPFGRDGACSRVAVARRAVFNRTRS